MSLSLRVDNSKKSCFFCSLKFLLWDYGELNTRLVLCRVNLDQNFKFVASQPNTVNGVWEGNQTSRGRYLIGKPARQVNGICRPVHSSLPLSSPPSDIPLPISVSLTTTVSNKISMNRYSFLGSGLEGDEVL